MTFLREIAAQLKSEFGPEISDLCLVVPTRRAVAFLREAIAQTYRQTLWAPQIISIQDLVRGLSGWQFPETLPLVFELYQVYKTIMRQQQPNWDEPFERFYAWGEMLVKDFDEIDKYLVDTQQLFTNIKDLKEIDLFFTLEPENLVPIRRFWETLRGKKEDLTEVQQEFLRIWQMLLDIYTGYKAQLAAKYQAYDGMAYRYLVQQLEEEKLTWPHKQTIFIGFNALSTAEERVMHFLLKEKKAIVYWDVDYVYFTPTKHESPEDDTALRDEGHLAGEEPGKFIDEYHYKWRDLDSRLILHNMRAQDKHIHITGVPLQVGQAQYLGNLMQDIQTDQTLPRDHALVLADEQMLFSTLYALPSHMEELNITMGFPLRQTNIHDLLLIVMRLLRNLKLTPDKKRVFGYKEIVQLVNNPYIKAANLDLSEGLQKEITQQNRLFISPEELQQKELPELLAHIFQPPMLPLDGKPIGDLEPVLTYCEGIFRLLLSTTEDDSRPLETEYVFQLWLQFQQLRDVLNRYQPRLTVPGFANLFRDMMQRARVPFEGEPLIGVQLMGFLETRVLDFERVYILASNEGKLPDTSLGNSFIPFNLRKGFGLPTYEEKDAIYAYHFYRLLQRTKEVHLIYDTVGDGSSPAEVSRFIRQIRHFFRGHPHLNVHERLISTPAPYMPPPEIRIPNGPEIEGILRNKYEGPQAKRYFSATALTSYLACPLQFYYRYVAGIREPDQVEETMEANTFGTVLHRTMEFLYEPAYKRKTVMTAEEVVPLKQRIEASLKQAFAESSLGWDEQVRGKNYLLRGVIEKQCEAILDQDAEGPNFQVIDLENDKDYGTLLGTEVGEMRVNGAFDRIDYLPDTDEYRILDYKTGQVYINAAHTNLEKIFEDPKMKIPFQGYIYAYLFGLRHPERRAQVGFYAVRKLSGGIQFLNKGNAIQPADREEFGARLQELISGIFEEDFRQTEDTSTCSYCAYNAICHRG